MHMCVICVCKAQRLRDEHCYCDVLADPDPVDPRLRTPTPRALEVSLACLQQRPAKGVRRAPSGGLDLLPLLSRSYSGARVEELAVRIPDWGLDVADKA